MGNNDKSLGMSGGVPAGWVLVPVEPTLDMQDSATTVPVDTGQGGITALNWEEAAEVWGKMLAATPTPPIEGRDADVERVEVVAKAIYDATHVGLSNCYAWDDEWEPYQEARRGRYYKEAAAAIAALQALGERP